MGFITDLSRFIQYGDLPTSYYTKRGMKVGSNLNRQSETKFDPSHCWLIKIGNDVTIANRVIFLAHDDSIRTATGYGKIGRIVIGNNVFIGVASIILPGVSVGDNTVIAAGSVVTKNIPSDSVAAGVPARVIGTYSELIEQAQNDMASDKSHTFDLSWSTYGDPPISDERKDKMFDLLGESHGYQKLWKLSDRSK